MTARCLGVLSALLLAPLLSAAVPLETASDKAKPFDWPQWQGPNRDAVSKETGLLKEWPKDGPPLAWKVSTLGGGYNAPSVAAGRIYGMSHRGGERPCDSGSTTRSTCPREPGSYWQWPTRAPRTSSLRITPPRAGRR